MPINWPPQIPDTSAWVSANAGSGKTHVLTQRVIRLMLAGNSPDRILCLTFTKAAAAEMKKRVFETLAQWTMMADETLDTAIQDMSGQKANAKSRQRARQLFARALDTPGGLKIQTIHAFCESLLHQFPLEANVPGHFETLQDADQAHLLELARREVLSNSSNAADHYAVLADAASDGAIEDGLSAVIAMREPFLRWIEDGIDNAIAPLYETLGVAPDDTPESIRAQNIATLPISGQQITRLVELAQAGSASTDQPVGEAFEAIHQDASREIVFSQLRTSLLTAKDTIRSRLVTAKVSGCLA